MERPSAEETEPMNKAHDVTQNEHDVTDQRDESPPYQNVTMESNKPAEQIERHEIKLDMGMHNDRALADPLARLEPLLTLLHRASPLQLLIYTRLTSEHFCQRQSKLGVVVLVTLLCGYVVYLGFAFSYRFGDEGSIRLLVITVLVLVGVTYHYIKKLHGIYLYTKYLRPCSQALRPYRGLLKLLITVAVTCSVLLFIAIDTCTRRPASLVSLLGILVFTLAMFFFSTDPRQVTWRPVLWGLLLQLVFGLLVLRTHWGCLAFQWLGARVSDYLAYTHVGTQFVFGPGITDIFAFSVLSVLVFTSATVSILYYLGVLQALTEKTAFILTLSLGTGAVESLHAAFNSFLGWAETIPLIRPHMPDMTLSELHTVMTNGFATAAGSTLAIYTMFGVPANHLLAASVMSAPAALAMSKLFYPETREIRRRKAVPPIIPRQGTGILDAASLGAVSAISLVTHILVSMIAFYSLIAFLNATLGWLGDRVGLTPPHHPALSFELICSFLFWPVAFLMGVAPADCLIVARMIGMKTFLNEFVAYQDLGKLRQNRLDLAQTVSDSTNLTWVWDGTDIVIYSKNVTLVGGVISPHSEMVATYALCGFANVAALGVMIGALAYAAPNRKQDILHVSIRALISGSVACFMTACIAGLLGDE